MSAYHQMGHNSGNLVLDTGLSSFAGVVLSPVNRNPLETQSDANIFASAGKLLIFDPQLYYPNSEKGELLKWPYFPQDTVGSEDLMTTSWWNALNNQLSECVSHIGTEEITEIASPAQVPRIASIEYYAHVLLVANQLQDKCRNRVIPTIIIDERRIVDRNYVMELASLLTGSKFQKFYFVFCVDVNPRHEISDPRVLSGLCLLLNVLAKKRRKTVVSHSSTDVLLWKAAGATDCATGKFFNLRRFTQSRYDPPKKGGGLLPYWIEENLLGFLREPDLIMYNDSGVISTTGLYADFHDHIMTAIAQDSAWIKESWLLYMSWFVHAEATFSNRDRAIQALDLARANWAKLLKTGRYPTEPTNDGAWIAAWKQALSPLV